MRKKYTGYIFGAVGAVIVVVSLLPFRAEVNHTTTALVLLLLVLITAAFYGSYPAFAASILAMLAFNFFFLPPYHTFRIADPQNWVALAAFLLTSVIAGSLSAREKRRAEEAENGKKEVERLYSELREAFEKASQAEALKQSEQLKSALLDAVTHDLRTPLTSMKAAATTLLSNSGESRDASLDLGEEGTRELLEVIVAEIDRLNHLLEGLIEMAKIEAGAMEPRRSWSNMEEIVAIALNRASAVVGRHRMRVNLEKDLPPVRVDEKAVAEIFYVLVENAAKYSDPDTDILLTVENNGERMLKAYVEDRGIGIPRELREKVFDKFFRISSPGHASRSRRSGLGMGLAIARGIVEAHGGRIWIEDAAGGVGTRVCFTIPLQASVAIAGAPHE